jgi:hypothetical protein
MAQRLLSVVDLMHMVTSVSGKPGYGGLVTRMFNYMTLSSYDVSCSSEGLIYMETAKLYRTFRWLIGGE